MKYLRPSIAFSTFAVLVASCGQGTIGGRATPAPGCPAGQVRCAGACIDTATNAQSCGACGVACVGGQTCAAGTCQCLPGLMPCATGCADLTSNGSNCGACGVACTAGTVCSAGVCSSSCATGVACGASCVNTATDPFHCGQCNVQCPAGQSCANAGCGCPVAGQLMCNGACVDPSSDGSHCGGCNLPCGAGASCVQGACMGGVGGAAGAAGAGGAAGGAGGSAGATGGDGGTAGASGGTTGGSAGSAGTGSTSEELAQCRGLVAVRSGNGNNYVGWRLKATDPANIAFNVYRGSTLVNQAPITGSTNYLDSGAAAGSTYQVRPVIDGAEQGSSETVTASPNSYISIPLNNNGTTQAGRLAGVADLDGDCKFDFVLKRSDGDRDVTQADSNPTETIKLEAYNGNGQFMWRRDVGPNTRPGVWFSPFVVFDLDGDGKAEVALKSAEIATTLGGDGDLNGDGDTDYKETNGDVYYNQYPDIEFLEVWNGETGATLARAPWIPVGPWGSDGNRYNRNMMSPAYLDGQQGSVLMTRGGNSRNEVHAYDYRNGQLTKRWQWIASNGAGNYGHNVRAADIDNDGKDEFLFFNVAIDDNGSTVLWNTEEKHGDRFHLSDIDPDRPGLEIFYIQEFNADYTHPAHLRDAATGALIWGPTGDWGDVGRGLCANIDANQRGIECWAVGQSELYNAKGVSLGARPNTPNMAIFWDADRERELISGTTISKWNGSGLQSQLSASGCSIGTRDIPMGYADILGDWREEAWWLCGGNSELRVYVSTAVTTFRMYSLMQDPEYRVGVGEMTQGYVQAPHPSFYVGSDMSSPPTPRLAIGAGK